MLEGQDLVFGDASPGSVSRRPRKSNVPLKTLSVGLCAPSWQRGKSG